MDRYFTTLGTRRLWLLRSQAVTCGRSCQQFTETWQHASQAMSGALCTSASMHAHDMCLCTEEGISALNNFCVSRSWKLYKTKPKLHMQQEIQCLWQPSLFQLWTNHLLSLLAELPQPREFINDQIKNGAEYVFNPNRCLPVNFYRYLCMCVCVRC